MSTMKEWGDAKARRAEEVTAKYERATDGSQFHKLVAESEGEY